MQTIVICFDIGTLRTKRKACLVDEGDLVLGLLEPVQQRPLEHRPDVPDGVEVWRVGGEEHEPDPGGLREGEQGGRAVEGRVVQDDDAAPRDEWQQHLLEISLHNVGVAVPLEGERADEAAASPRGALA